MTILFFSYNTSVSRGMFRQRRQQTRDFRRFRWCVWNNRNFVNYYQQYRKSYLANTERHQEPTAHRHRRQKPLHRGGHFTGWPGSTLATVCVLERVTHSPKDPPEADLSRHIFFVLREESHRICWNTVTIVSKHARKVATRRVTGP